MFSGTVIVILGIFILAAIVGLIQGFAVGFFNLFKLIFKIINYKLYRLWRAIVRLKIRIKFFLLYK